MDLLQRAVLTHFAHGFNDPNLLELNKEMLGYTTEYLSKDSLEKIGNIIIHDLKKRNVLNQIEPPFPIPQSPKFTFIDLFAGIGGFRLAMQGLGGKCLFSSEWDAEAQKTYFANFGHFFICLYAGSVGKNRYEIKPSGVNGLFIVGMILFGARSSSRTSRASL